MAHMRTVIESAAVSDRIDAEARVHPRLEEAFDALKWWLSRQPQSGELLDDCHWLYRQKGKSNPAIPALVSLYVFNNDEVEILSIMVRPPAT
jgi:hypothetical protein